jgi:hypothetical protein
MIGELKEKERKKIIYQNKFKKGKSNGMGEKVKRKRYIKEIHKEYLTQF